jgi:hypothetical protein
MKMNKLGETRKQYTTPLCRLICLETAKATVQTGFSTIDWGNDPEELG